MLSRLATGTIVSTYCREKLSPIPIRTLLLSFSKLTFIPRCCWQWASADMDDGINGIPRVMLAIQPTMSMLALTANNLSQHKIFCGSDYKPLAWLKPRKALVKYVVCPLRAGRFPLTTWDSFCFSTWRCWRISSSHTLMRGALSDFCNKYSSCTEYPFALRTHKEAIVSAPLRLHPRGRLLSLAERIWLTWPSALHPVAAGYSRYALIPSQFSFMYRKQSVIAFLWGSDPARQCASWSTRSTCTISSCLIAFHRDFFRSL